MPLIALLLSKIETGNRNCLMPMQQESASAGSPGPQQDPALPHTPTMPPPESLSEGHQPNPIHSPTEQATEEEFQFLRCQSCQIEAKCPKLLPCLHTLCSGCLEAPGMQCRICQVPWLSGAEAPALDNVFFESLQRRLAVHRQIVDAQAVCTRCQEPADFWCFECEQLLCAKCFEAHQWFLKHESQPLSELRSQSVREFLDGTRKSNNIFCSNPNHRTPTLTSIYCRGCSKPLCCSCALLDSGHSELKCDINAEIQQRQEELDTMIQDLREQDRAFGAAHAQMRSAVSQLGRARADTEELIRARVRQVVAHLMAQERQLLEEVNARYQREYGEMAAQLSRLDAVLQRIRMGGALVQRMKLYASDQEVLDMHGFLREALCRLRQEEPQSQQVSVRSDSFDEFKVRLQNITACITQGTDAALPRTASPEAASSPSDPTDSDLTEKVQRAQAQVPGLAETQPVAMVQSVPGAHPVPVYAYSIKDSSFREEVSDTVIPQKRKSCQTEGPRKAIKMESEDEKEARLAQRSPEQPRPSTSKAVSPPHLDGRPSPESPTTGSEDFLPNSNHATSDPGEAEERIVVISSSEDSDAEDSPAEPTETEEPQSASAHPLPGARGAPHPCRASCLPRGTCRPLAWPPHHPSEHTAVTDAKSPSQPASHREDTAVRRGRSFLSYRTQRRTCRHIFQLPFKPYGAPVWDCPPSTVQATTPASPQECPARLQRAIRQPCQARGAVRSRGRSLRGSHRVVQWLNRFFALPLSSVAPQLYPSLQEAVGGGGAPLALRAGISPQDSDRAPTENPQVQVPLGVPPIAFQPRRLQRPPTSPAPLREASESP
ncbi:protein PML isoform X6 [Manis pentadactyla]|uniref:protein PML isoform X6 n=1 Tax=Manis pentadactyla TaxID=143292 RepID=UPI00255C734B|nr:protein PML isoform X6 [Manis pentadactyla]